MTDLTADERLNELIEGLDAIGKDRDKYEYGLPIYNDEWMERMRQFLREWLARGSNDE